MSNTLKMENQILIQQLLKLGWSYRRIEKETGIRRETISKCDPNHPRNQQRAKAANVPTGSGIENGTKPENRPKCPPTPEPDHNSALANHATGGCDGAHTPIIAVPLIQKPTRISNAAPFDLTIRQKFTLGLSAQRIYQDLVSDHDFKYGYDCIKRYIRKLSQKEPKVFARIHTLPGEEAQVDFGRGAPTLKNGRYACPWFFKMVLSYSRHSYEECVWTQDVETFLRCHEHAFSDFGGVPALIRIDNLKSGVLKAHLFEPELNPVYTAFAKHYDFAILPCLPGKPEHKGKTESGVGYTKDNALKGLKFASLEAQNVHLRAWNKRWARTRIHGTTKKQVWAMFVQEEKPALKPLPEQLFQFFQIGRRNVHEDGHIEVNKAYYSVPHQFIGQDLSVQFNSKWVKVLSGEILIAFHTTIAPGRFQTNKSHLPESKCISTEEYKTKLLQRCEKIGCECRRWAMQVIKERNQLGFRAIQGVLQLQKQHSIEKINWACGQTLKLGSVRYHTVKALCADQEQENKNDPGVQLELLQDHRIIRPIEEYQLYLASLQTDQP